MGSAIAIRHQNYLASVLWSFLGTGGLSDCWDSVLWQNKREDDRGEMSPQTGFAAREPRETQLGVVGMFRAPWCSLSSILPWEVCDCSRVGPSTNGMCSWRTNSGWQKSERKHSGVPGYTLGLLHWPALDRGGRWPLGWGKPKLTALSNIGIGHVWSNKQQLRKRWIETIAIQSVCLKWLIR